MMNLTLKDINIDIINEKLIDAVGTILALRELGYIVNHKKIVKLNITGLLIDMLHGVNSFPDLDKNGIIQMFNKVN